VPSRPAKAIVPLKPGARLLERSLWRSSSPASERLPPASKLTLYFTETDQALSTTRSAAQLDDFRQRLIETARRIRAGDFSANPDQWRCGRCDYRLICPSRYGAQAPA
ncbi:MAG TPA: PD-(D/E)XK nuclease family protein, partial [Candidatus Limnocylindria bacterium]|nr:PD-(D/E)XK nuclease family protein [Candidatus Limnocylindria bacterium]